MPGERRLPRAVTLGGQAVVEGVMMRGASVWAVAVRTPAGRITVQRFELEPPAARHRLLRLPLIRGVVALTEALQIGARALALAAAAQRPEGERPAPSRRSVVALALVVGTASFFVAPAALARGLGQGVLAEAVLRCALFVGYLALLARRRGMRRLLEYHGAEHQAVACHEARLPLTPEHAQGCARLHPRCGTSFVALVTVVAGLVLVPFGELGWAWLIASRVLAVPLAAGLAFELVGWAVRARRDRLLSPLVALQRLTTREPDRAQLEVALAALGAVLAVEAPAPAPVALDVAA